MRTSASTQIKRITLILITQISFWLSGCSSSITSGDSNPISSISFPGISSIDEVSGNGVRINWHAVSGASTYYIYDTTSGSLVYLAYVPSTTTSYIVTGLTPSTTYSFLVRMVDTLGQRDANTNYVSATTQSTTISHQGWTQAKAVGGRTPVTQATGLTTTSPSVTLGWNQMTSSNATVTSYNVYRGTSSAEQNYSSPLASGISTLSYTDTTPSAETTYFYVVKPVVGTQELATTSTDTEIKIMVPPTNMSLVHRWIANWEMCSNLMGRTPDRDNNYRCAYVGPGNNGGYYDFGHSQWWDTVELGCNYTPPNATASLSCNDSTNGCLGNGAPAAVVADGQVYYDRTNGVCYLRSGAAWVATNSASAAQLALLASNAPGLPPLTVISQIQSGTVCQQFSISGFGSKRLPKHSEQVVAGAWPTSYTDALISTLENGTSLPSSGYCNSNSGSGLTYDANATPANLETLPGNSGSSVRSVRTGGNSTQNCISLHGIQDYVGNVWEWSSDQFSTCSSVSHTCTTTGVGSIDATNTDWYWSSGTLPINYNGVVGPGGVTMTDWAFAAMSNSATDFLAPLGLPLLGSVSASYDSMDMGSASGQFDTAKFHGDHFWLHTDSSSGSVRGAVSGGRWVNGTNGGRFTLALDVASSVTGSGIGLRCLAPAID